MITEYQLLKKISKSTLNPNEKIYYMESCDHCQEYRSDIRKRKYTELSEKLDIEEKKKKFFKNDDDDVPYIEKIVNLDCSKQNLKIVKKKYKQLEHGNNTIAPWLDLILSLPHDAKFLSSKSIKEADKDIEKMKNHLEKNIYGQHNIKKTILEWLVRFKYSPQGSVRNLALLGDPGTGKTLIANTIAECIEFPFYSVDLGVIDELSLLGLNFSYKDSQEGAITKAMSHFYTETGTKSGVIFFDEIVKTKGDRHHRKLVSGLLAITDPKFRNKFVDEYLCGMTQDLTGVLMIFAMNDIPEEKALQDRLEIIEMEKYTDEDKKNIIEQFIIPDQLKKLNISEYSFVISPECIQVIIEKSPTSSIRVLEKLTKKIIDNLFLLYLKKPKEKIKNLRIVDNKLTPQPRYIEDVLHDVNGGTNFTDKLNFMYI